MSARSFFDTNTLVYILEGNDPPHGIALTPDEIEANRKGDITLRLLQSENIVVGSKSSTSSATSLCGESLIG